MRRASGTVTEVLGLEAVVWLETDRSLHLLDAAALAVWAALGPHPQDPEDVARAVLRGVEGDPQRVRDEVLTFLAQLTNQSLVVTE